MKKILLPILSAIFSLTSLLTVDYSIAFVDRSFKFRDRLLAIPNYLSLKTIITAIRIELITLII